MADTHPRGTLFTPEAINNQTAIAGLIIALSPRAPPTDIIAQAISLYPSDPAAGSSVLSIPHTSMQDHAR